MSRRPQVYAVYKGEQNLADGTAKELAKKLNVSVKFIHAISCKAYHQQVGSKNRMIAIKIEDEKWNE